MQIVTRGKAIVSKIVSILMSAVLIFGSVYMYQTHDAIEDISGDTLGKQVHSVLVVVRKDDPAEKVWDTKDYVYGVQSIEDDSEMAEAMKKVNADAGKKVLTKDFDTLHDQVAGLFSETVDAIVYDESFSGIIEEVNEGYNSKVKIIAQYSIESENDSMTQGTSPDVNVKEEPFSMFISGIDVYGPISSKSRSLSSVVTSNISSPSSSNTNVRIPPTSSVYNTHMIFSSSLMLSGSASNPDSDKTFYHMNSHHTVQFFLRTYIPPKYTRRFRAQRLLPQKPSPLRHLLFSQAVHLSR